MGNEALSRVLPTWVSQSRQLYHDKKLFDTALHTLSLSIIDPYGADHVSLRHGPGIQEPPLFSSTIWSRHTGWLEWCHIVRVSLLSMVSNERGQRFAFSPVLGVIEAKQGWVKRLHMEKAPPSLIGFWCFNSSSTSRDLIKTVSVILGAYTSVSEGDAAKWKKTQRYSTTKIYHPVSSGSKPRFQTSSPQESSLSGTASPRPWPWPPRLSFCKLACWGKVNLALVLSIDSLSWGWGL